MTMQQRSKPPEIDRERRTFTVEMRVETREDDKKKVMRGHAAVFNEYTDLGWFMERVMPGAFKESIARDDVRALFNHDMNFVLGRNKSGTLRLSEDERGLAVEIDPPDTQQARDILTLMERGDITQMSFGFNVLEETWTSGQDKEPDKRDLVKVRLWDVSPVTFPAYTNTDIAVHQRDAFFAARQQAAQPEHDTSVLSLIQMRNKLRQKAKEVHAKMRKHSAVQTLAAWGLLLIGILFCLGLTGIATQSPEAATGILWAGMPFMVGAVRLQDLLQTRKEKFDKIDAILQKAIDEKRALTPEEETETNTLNTDIEGLDKVIDLEKKVSEARTRGAAPVKPSGMPAPAVHIPGQVEPDDEFRNLGEFIYAVRFYQTDKDAERKLVKSNTEYREHYLKDGSSGGFMVPKTMLGTLLEVTPQEAIFRPRATVMPAGENPDGEFGMVALDQTAAQGMYGGVAVGWTGEGEVSGETNMRVREISMQPQEVTGHMIITDKLLRNWTAAGALIERQLRRAVMKAEDDAFFGGNGIKKPLGIFNSNATIAVNRATASQISYTDIINMEANIYDGGAAFYVANRKTMPQLANVRDTGNNNLFIQNATQGMPATLMGRPLIWHEKSPTLGSKGDLMLIDPTYYTIKDGSGIFVAASEHVFFRNNKTVIKILWNVDGKPWLTEALAMTDFNGTAAGNFSPFVVLDVP